MNIEWKGGVVCYANGRQWCLGMCISVIDDMWLISEDSESKRSTTITSLIDEPDFQLNIPREGDYLRKEELPNESMYNDAVEVFGLFGYELYHLSQGFRSLAWHTKLAICDGELINSIDDEVRELTYNQLMTIGAIKRLLIGTVCEKAMEDFVKVNDTSTEDIDTVTTEGKNIRRNKSKQAYDILQSLDYEYDLVEQRWYRKDWV